MYRPETTLTPCQSSGRPFGKYVLFGGLGGFAVAAPFATLATYTAFRFMEHSVVAGTSELLRGTLVSSATKYLLGAGVGVAAAVALGVVFGAIAAARAKNREPGLTYHVSVAVSSIAGMLSASCQLVQSVASAAQDGASVMIQRCSTMTQNEQYALVAFLCLTAAFYVTVPRISS